MKNLVLNYKLKKVSKSKECWKKSGVSVSWSVWILSPSHVSCPAVILYPVRPWLCYYIPLGFNLYTWTFCFSTIDIDGLEVIVGHHKDFDFSAGDVAGVLFQYPDTNGIIEDYEDLVARAKAGKVLYFTSLCMRETTSWTGTVLIIWPPFFEEIFVTGP